jgi:hypothetical protein
LENGRTEGVGEGKRSGKKLERSQEIWTAGINLSVQSVESDQLPSSLSRVKRGSKHKSGMY